MNKSQINLPKTAFSMKANLPTREPEILNYWQEINLYEQLRNLSKGNGYYVGPTIIDYVTPEMKIAKEEVFGPVLAIMRTEEIDHAIKIENSSNYGNASSVYTQDGKLANYITEKVSAGMVGVNIGVPVPREPFSFGGWNESRFGVGDITGKSSINFWTRLKKRTSKWNASAKKNWMS